MSAMTEWNRPRDEILMNVFTRAYASSTIRINDGLSALEIEVSRGGKIRFSMVDDTFTES